MNGRRERDSPERPSTDQQTGPSPGHAGWTEVVNEGALEGYDGAPPEANVILISHPEDELLGRRWQLRSGAVLEIGRSSRCDVSLPDTMSVSRTHARLKFEQGQVRLEDLSSTNGTYINDERIQGTGRLTSGDRFQVGTVHFKFLQEFDVENAYYETLYQLAVRDGLTETFNKRKFDEELEREFQRSSRYDRALSLVLVDLDHFKAVNDTHGHLCGDYVLQEVTKIVSRHLRPEQTFARVGGEEFAILSPETTLDGAARLAEKLRSKIAAGVFEFAGIELSVTCSFGAAAKTADISSAAALYEAADRALYRAKAGGRDRVCGDDSG